MQLVSLALWLLNYTFPGLLEAGAKAKDVGVERWSKFCPSPGWPFPLRATGEDENRGPCSPTCWPLYSHRVGTTVGSTMFLEKEGSYWKLSVCWIIYNVSGHDGDSRHELLLFIDRSMDPTREL